MRQLLIDRTGQHHFRDFHRGRIGDAQTVDKLRLHPCPVQHGANLRPAAMHDDGVNADKLQ